MIKSKYFFCLEKAGVKIINMTVKATENCVKSLMAKGINADSIVVLTPTVFLDIAYLQSSQVDCVSKDEIPCSNPENCFESFTACMDMTETELDAILTETEDDNFLFNSIDCVIQAIKSVRFNWPECPIQMLQAYLQAKGLGLEVFENNPMLFTAFKQKLYKEFQRPFPGYSSLLQYININNFHWQVMCLWEFLVNTQIDERTYEWLKILIDS